MAPVAAYNNWRQYMNALIEMLVFAGIGTLLFLIIALPIVVVIKARRRQSAPAIGVKRHSKRA